MEECMQAPYRRALPQLDGGLYLADGGIETSLIFNDGIDLPHFAAIDLFRRPGGEAALQRYFAAYLRIAARFGVGLVLESATWRASADWGRRLGHTPRTLNEANRRAIRLLEELRAAHPAMALVISGCVGPRGDGYEPACLMSADEACDYHQDQIDTFAGTTADMVGAITMNYVEEATGIALAARYAGMPVAISFTVETDGRLPTGQPLGAAIQEVDTETGGYPSYYMLNCAHPEHFAGALDGPWTARIRGLRANASRKSHAELNASTELDTGDPVELGAQYAELAASVLPSLNVMGGCCGTDYRHVEKIAAACSPLFRSGARDGAERKA
ncbi:MAG TPA: homocysteine S-methyltransferase family protein [Burkholderiales bacterium]|jgi:homocysteine S-methyltransferase|nr:homocysteine S-methyltransferase family protein [Burkholderiales bacterium]